MSCHRPRRRSLPPPRSRSRRTDRPAKMECSGPSPGSSRPSEERQRSCRRPARRPFPRSRRRSRRSPRAGTDPRTWRSERAAPRGAAESGSIRCCPGEARWIHSPEAPCTRPMPRSRSGPSSGPIARSTEGRAATRWSSRGRPPHDRGEAVRNPDVVGRRSADEPDIGARGERGVPGHPSGAVPPDHPLLPSPPHLARRDRRHGQRAVCRCDRSPDSARRRLLADGPGAGIGAGPTRRPVAGWRRRPSPRLDVGAAVLRASVGRRATVGSSNGAHVGRVLNLGGLQRSVIVRIEPCVHAQPAQSAIRASRLRAHNHQGALPGRPLRSCCARGPLRSAVSGGSLRSRCSGRPLRSGRPWRESRPASRRRSRRPEAPASGSRRRRRPRCGSCNRSPAIAGCCIPKGSAVRRQRRRCPTGPRYTSAARLRRGPSGRSNRRHWWRLGPRNHFVHSRLPRSPDPRRWQWSEFGNTWDLLTWLKNGARQQADRARAFLSCADAISSEVGPSQPVVLLDSNPGAIRTEDFGDEQRAILSSATRLRSLTCARAIRPRLTPRAINGSVSRSECPAATLCASARPGRRGDRTQAQASQAS